MEDVGNDIKCALLDGTYGLVFAGDGKELKIWDLRQQASIGSVRSRSSEEEEEVVTHELKSIYTTNFVGGIYSSHSNHSNYSLLIQSPSLHSRFFTLLFSSSSLLSVRLKRILLLFASPLITR